MKQELVSIIMPSYNTGKFIKETIDSVLSQSYQNWELLIVDDCSSDNTEEIVGNFQDDRIKFYKHETNQGAAYSRNRALKQAKGRWIAFLDSDDLWSNNKLKEQLDFMEDNNYSFSYTNYEEIDEKGQPLGKIVTGPKRITKTGMFNYCWPGCLTVMYDSSKIGLVQIENIRKNNDYAMWLKVIKQADCYLLDKNLAKYRKRTGSISNQGYLSLIKWHYRLFKQCENQSVIRSLVNTIRNLIFGLYKKIIYSYEQKENF